MRSSLVAALFVTVVTPVQVGAQVATPTTAPVERLGLTRGTVLLTSDLALDFQRVTVRAPGVDPVTSTSYDLRAGFDRVVYPRVTVGFWLGIDGELQDLDQRKRFELGGRAGGLIPLGPTTAWWPSLGMGYAITELADRANTASLRTWTLTLASPFLWQPRPHVLLGAGPMYAADVKSKTGPTSEEQGPKASAFGLHGLIGLTF